MNAATSKSAPAGVMGKGAALLLQAVIVVTFLAAAAAPSPLYAIYRAAWGFSALTLTAVFASYALALLAALLVFGSSSDHVGRRPVLLVALGLEIGSLLLFWHAESVAWLFAARVVQGLATGIATATLNAGLVDLHRERGPLVNSAAPMVGMGIGALGTSLLMQYAAGPTRLVFELLLVLCLVWLALSCFLPETAAPVANGWRTVWRAMKPAIAIPAAARRTLWRVMPVNVALWALGGFYLSLGPTLARGVTGIASPIVGGSLIATLVFCSALAVLAVRSIAPGLVLPGGALFLGAGMAVTLAGVALHASVPLFAGTVIAGFGFGASFYGAMRSLVPLAAPHERAGLLSAFFAVSYLAFSVPAMLAGLAAGVFGLQDTVMGYGAVLIALSVAALLLMRRSA
jgi:MFS family permease